MQGKTLLMAGVAVVALVASSDAGLAKTKHHATDAVVRRFVAARFGVERTEQCRTCRAAVGARRGTCSRSHQARRRSQSALDLGAEFQRRRFGRSTMAVRRSRSADGRFTMSFRARFQSDFAGFMQSTDASGGFRGPADLSSGAVIRRAYFGVEGTAYKDFAYEIRLNAGGSDGGTMAPAGVPTGGRRRSTAEQSADHLHRNSALAPQRWCPRTGLHVRRHDVVGRADFHGTSGNRQHRGRHVRCAATRAAASKSAGKGPTRSGRETISTSRRRFTGGKTGSAANHGNGGDENSQLLGRISDRVWTDGALSNIVIGASGAYVPYAAKARRGGSPNVAI